MAAVARVAFPSTSRRPSTLPVSSTTALRTTVPWDAPERAPTGYFGGTLWASRFSAPFEERMIALFSPGSGASDGVAAAASFLPLTSLSLALLASGFVATGAVGAAAAEAGGATAVPGVAVGGTAAVAVPDAVGEPVAEPVAELIAESGAFDCV